MAGILSPSTIRKNFENIQTPTFTVIKEDCVGDIIISFIYIDGNEVNGERTKIFAKYLRNKNRVNTSAILLVQDLKDATGTVLSFSLIKNGFDVLVVDIEGEAEGKEYYTKYASGVEYANLSLAKIEETEIEQEYLNTAWYEWDTVLKYSYNYLSTRENITAVGLFGINDGATLCWHLAFSEDVKCFVSVGGSGWQAYHGTFKFGTNEEEQFSDNTLKYIAGVESETYAQNIKCPVLLLSPTNSPFYNFERAYDTVSRIDGVYYAFNASNNRIYSVDYDSYIDATLFLKKYLSDNQEETVLPNPITVQCTENENKLFIDVFPDLNEINSVNIYISEVTEKSGLCCWKKKTDVSSVFENGFRFSFNLENLPQKLMFYARVKYSNGFSVCSPVSYKKIETEVLRRHNKLLYSSREMDNESVFSPYFEHTVPTGICIDQNVGQVKVLSGAKNMYGATCNGGIMTFRINSDKYKPEESSILMFDVFSKKDSEFIVKIISDFYGEKKEYSYSISLYGGVWQNIKIVKNNFKTEEGIALKEYKGAECIAFNNKDDSEYLINNILWV